MLGSRDSVVNKKDGLLSFSDFSFRQGEKNAP